MIVRPALLEDCGSTHQTRPHRGRVHSLRQGELNAHDRLSVASAATATNFEGVGLLRFGRRVRGHCGLLRQKLVLNLERRGAVADSGR